MRRTNRLIAIMLGWVPLLAVAGPDRDGPAELILKGAREEVERRVCYDPRYREIGYPGGDVPAGVGVCTDLVVRALRKVGIDLQKAIHEDRRAHPEAYPTHLWANPRPDPNIDHRRCSNLVVWFRRYARALPTELDATSLRKHWRGGDIVFFIEEGEKYPWHVAVVSDRRAEDGMPLIIDNMGPYAAERFRLDRHAPVHSHFRLSEATLRWRGSCEEAGGDAHRGHRQEESSE